MEANLRDSVERRSKAAEQSTAPGTKCYKTMASTLVATCYILHNALKLYTSLFPTNVYAGVSKDLARI